MTMPRHPATHEAMKAAALRSQRKAARVAQISRLWELNAGGDFCVDGLVRLPLSTRIARRTLRPTG